MNLPGTILETILYLHMCADGGLIQDMLIHLPDIGTPRLMLLTIIPAIPDTFQGLGILLHILCLQRLHQPTTCQYLQLLQVPTRLQLKLQLF